MYSCHYYYVLTHGQAAYATHFKRHFKRYTIKPGTPEHRTTEHGIPAQQRNTPEQWRNNGTPRNTSGTPRNQKNTNKKIPTEHQSKHQLTTLKQQNHGKQRTNVVILKKI